MYHRQIRLLSFVSAILIVTVWLWNQKEVPQPHRDAPREPQSGVASNERLTQFTLFDSKINKSPLDSTTHRHSPTPVEKAEIARKMSILDEIFISKNDNDPRLDTQFKDLAPIEKEALQQKYNTTKPENRNERGTLVFLLSRNLESSADFEFLKKVVAEKRCSSLTNCHAELAQSTPQHHEDTGENEVTLEYPQIVAIKALETHLTQHHRTPSITEVLNEAMNSKHPITSRLAQTLNQKYKEQP